MNKILIVYWSGTGNAKQMADLIAEGAKSAGAETEVRSVSEIGADEVGRYGKIAFGKRFAGAA